MPDQETQTTAQPFGLDLEPKRRPRFLSRLPVIAAIGVLLIGLLVTFLVARTEHQHAEHEDALRFDQLVQRMQADITRQLGVYRHGLMGTRSVFAASKYVDRDEFILMVESRGLDKEFPGALGIGYIERVPDDPEAVSTFIQRVHDEGAPWFEITVPPGSAPLPGSIVDGRQIIKYIEPLADNRSAHGLEIGAHPVRREAAERALVVNDASLTGTIQLVQDEQKVAGFLYLLPFYQPGMPVQTLEQRIAALRGWVYMPMLGPKVFEGIGGSTNDELDIDVFDGEALTAQTLIYDADGHLDPERVAYTEADYAGRDHHVTREIEIGGRVWTLSISSTDSFQRVSRSGVWAIALGGVALSILLAILIYMQGSSTRRAWTLAEGMTADLRAYAEQAQQATFAKSAFLANMSHEIRTPMTAILGFADLLRAQMDQENRELVEHTQTIKRNGEHLLRLINDILDISKIEAGKLQVERIDVRPDAVICEVLSLMRVKADEKKLPLEARLATPIPEAIPCDPVRLRQILVNLVGNAIKFTDAGGVSIEVQYDELSCEMSFTVIDTGVGMTEDQAARLFGAFEQADVTTTREYGGTGLGLHISQRLAEALDGEITYTSEPGKGSRFTLKLFIGAIEAKRMMPAGPLSAIYVADQNAPTASIEDPNAGPPLEGLRILLAEDGKDNQRLLDHLLRRAGASVTIVENGRLALEALTVDGRIDGPLLDDPPFDLLLSDMQMPEMDGYTAVRRLRALGSTLPIVALTAHAMKEDVAKCLGAGCDVYASKPINKQGLVEACSEALHGRPVSA